MCKIDTTKYDKIYSLKDNLAGSILLTKGRTYHYVICGSGYPVLGQEKGILSVEHGCLIS